MPKDEIDPDDPMELHGVQITGADEREMVMTVVDEYIRMGFGREELITLFADPRYTMTHRIWKQNGETYVRDCVRDVLDRWAAGGR